MTAIPKIVHQRLRSQAFQSASLAQSHPEADLLTAFAEQTLSTPERDLILQHLALCADCRDVLALASPADALASTPPELETEIPAPMIQISEKVRSSWFAWDRLGWQNLGWVALAGGLAVAILIAGPGVEHLFKPNQPATPVATLSNPAAQPSGSDSRDKISTSEKTAESKPASVAPPSDTVSNTSNLALATSPQSTRQKESDQARFDQSIASNDLKKNDRNKNGFKNRSLSADLSLQLGNSAAKADTLSAAAPRNEASTDNILMARDYAPAIEKAKPPLKDSDTAFEAQKTSSASMGAGMTSLASSKLAPSSMAALRAAAPPVIPAPTANWPNANWKIDAGVLQRSLDAGKSWQTAVQSSHALTCYSNRGNEVWAGGKAGTLLHSTDGGANWTAVAPSFEGQSLSSDVIHIDVHSLNEVILVTDNQEMWNSPDGGKTWIKK